MKSRRPDFSVLKATIFYLGLNLLLSVAAMGILVFSARLISGADLLSFISPTSTPVVIGYTSHANEGDSSFSRQPWQDLLHNQSDILRSQSRYLEVRVDAPNSFHPSPANSMRMGDEHTFWVTNKEENHQYQVSAHLAYAGETVNFWVEDELDYRWDELFTLADAFEKEIIPRNRDLLSMNRLPGDDHTIHILYTHRLASTTAGYFSNADTQPVSSFQLPNPYYMIFLNAKKINLSSEYTYGVLSHEFAHMIQWTKDRDEEVWLAEGLSELAAYVNGYRVGSFDVEYAKNPDIPLTVWPGRDGNATPHYGASFLFVDYIRGRFGDQIIRDLVENPLNGMAGVAEVLGKAGALDSLSNQPLSTEDLLLDWAIANAINRRGIYRGIYGYKDDPAIASMQPADKIITCPSSTLTRSVNQYGVDYVAIRCRGLFRLEFEGTTQTALFPGKAHSGRYVFWSGQGENIETTLTHTFELSHTRPPITLYYWTWFDLEKESDYVNLFISADEEKTWHSLLPQYGSKRRGNEDEFDWGYTGKTKAGRWVEEKLDLSPYAGQVISLQFRYRTDEVFSGPGFFLDDLRIPEIGYTTDFEEDDGRWQANGFVRVINALPQRFRLALIRPGALPGIVRLNLEPDNTMSIPLAVTDTATLVISAVNPVTRLPAAYRFRIKAAAP